MRLADEEFPSLRLPFTRTSLTIIAGTPNERLICATRRGKHMTKHGDDQAFILQENSGWLRYVLWGCAIGFCVLAVSVINAPVRDVGKVIGSVMGVLLFGFSGYVIRTRHITVDPLSQKSRLRARVFGRKPRSTWRSRKSRKFWC